MHVFINPKEDKTLLHKNNVRNHFSLAAKTYEANAIIQKKMAVSLIEDAKNSGRTFSRILEIGCGTGYLTRLLTKTFPAALLYATDISPLMLDQAEKLHPDCAKKQTTFFTQDGENLSLEGSFDLIISNAAFQWFNNYDNAFSGFAARLNSNGLLLYTTFGPATFNELHTSFRQTRQALQLNDEKHGPDFISATDLSIAAAKTNLRCEHLEFEERVFFPSAREFLQSVKKIGATHAPLTTSGFNRRLLPETISYYDRTFRHTDGRIYATYHIITGKAEKI